MSAAPIVRCDGLVHVYPDGTRGLDGIDLEIVAGACIALTGPNGAGKTTLVRHWNGLLRPTSGTVTVDGRPAHGRHVGELARVVGITAQDPSTQLFASTCRDEVAFGPRNVGLRGPAVQRAVGDALALVGLEGEAGTNPYDLGPSRRRLLAIASIVAMGTPVVVLDEPTAGLDADQVEVVRAMVQTLTARRQSVIAISHDPRLLGGRLFRREIRIEAGRVAS